MLQRNGHKQRKRVTKKNGLNKQQSGTAATTPLRRLTTVSLVRSHHQFLQNRLVKLINDWRAFVKSIIEIRRLTWKQESGNVAVTKRATPNRLKQYYLSLIEEIDKSRNR